MKRKNILIGGIILCLIIVVTVSALTDIDDNLIQTTGNLTLGQIITFTLGESVDNIFDGWIRIVGGLNVTQNLMVGGTVSLKEQADANADVDAYGQIWVDTATPNTLFFTDDAGTDFQIGGLKTYYWSGPGTNFHVKDDVKSFSYLAGKLRVDTDGTFCYAPVTGIPNGATITAAIVYGSISDEAWQLRRNLLSTGEQITWANGNINTEDTSISGAPVNNNLYSYTFDTASLDNTDEIYGARITYTTSNI